MIKDSMKFEMTEKELFIYEKIQNYVAGNMSDAEKTAFEKEVQADNAIAQELEIYKNLIPVISPPIAEERALRSTLKELHTKTVTKNTGSGKTFNLKWLMPLAASTILLFGLMKFISTDSNGTNLDQFYNYEKIALVSKSDQDRNYSELQRAFNSADYESSIALASEILKTIPKNPDVMLAKGIAEMETGDLEESIRSFKALKAENLRVDKSDWFTALALVKLGKKQEAITTLQSIVDNKSFNHVQATKLLQSLK